MLPIATEGIRNCASCLGLSTLAIPILVAPSMPLPSMRAVVGAQTCWASSCCNLPLELGPGLLLLLHVFAEILQIYGNSPARSRASRRIHNSITMAVALPPSAYSTLHR